MRAAAALLAGAAVYAAVEVGLALALGFFAWGRAEALLFLAWRPPLLLAAALLIARFGWRRRAAFYAAALPLAALSETVLLIGLGAAYPWPGALRGLAAGAGVALLLDLLVQLGRRLHRRWGPPLAALAAAALFLVPGGARPYETVALGPKSLRPATERPRLLMMTGLPIVWGETGPFDPASRPAAAYRMLRHEFDVRPLDYLDSETLGAGRLMLLAQPRMLEPTELVALDAWVRGGGRLLVLADPELTWPSRLPPGDVRRPPPASLLSPLLAHWRLELRSTQGRGPETRLLRVDGERRRLATAGVGRWRPLGAPCAIEEGGLVADCAIGAGRALLVADADLMRDGSWMPPLLRGDERHLRLADNPLIVADWLDRLGGIERERSARPVAWADPEADRWLALLLAALPILAALGAALIVLRFPRGHAHRLIHKGVRAEQSSNSHSNRSGVSP